MEPAYPRLLLGVPRLILVRRVLIQNLLNLVVVLLGFPIIFALLHLQWVGHLDQLPVALLQVEPLQRHFLLPQVRRIWARRVGF